MTGNADTAPAPTLPDGIVIIVKEECETCQTVVPVLQQLHAATELTVYTQDNASFPSAPTSKLVSPAPTKVSSPAPPSSALNTPCPVK